MSTAKNIFRYNVPLGVQIAKGGVESLALLLLELRDHFCVPDSPPQPIPPHFTGQETGPQMPNVCHGHTATALENWLKNFVRSSQVIWETDK